MEDLRGLRFAVAAGSIALLIGCSDEPTAPTPEPDSVPAPAFSHSGEPVELGTTSIPMPSQRTPNSWDDVPWFSTGIMVDSGAYFRIRVTGEIGLSANERYRTTFNCDQSCFPLDGQSVGPLGYPLQVKFGFQAGDPADYSAVHPSEYYLKPVYEADGTLNPAAGEKLVWAQRRGNVWVYRDSGHGRCNNVTNCTEWIPTYTYSGSGQQVTVTQVFPVQVHAANLYPATGEPVDFDVTIEGKLDYGYDGLPKISWTYALLDTLSTPKKTYTRELSGCYGQTTCRYIPESSLSGRMWAAAFVEGLNVQSQSPIIWVGRAQPKLRCAPDVVPYGVKTTCTASSEPADPDFAVLSWSFVGDQGASDAAAGGPLTWTFAPPENGLVNAMCRVGGLDLPAEARVEAICNLFAGPTGDEVLDDGRAQRALRELGRETGWDNPDLSQRAEHGGLFYLDGEGRVQFKEFKLQPAVGLLQHQARRQCVNRASASGIRDTWQCPHAPCRPGKVSEPRELRPSVPFEKLSGIKNG